MRWNSRSGRGVTEGGRSREEGCEWGSGNDGTNGVKEVGRIDKIVVLHAEVVQNAECVVRLMGRRNVDDGGKRKGKHNLGRNESQK